MGVVADSAAREEFMRLALEQARRGMAAGGPPVGACIVVDGEVIATTHNHTANPVATNWKRFMILLVCSGV